jgi:hypothetical protein
MTFRLRWPTQFSQINQFFLENPADYAKFKLPGHEGLDFHTEHGSQIFACADGEVVRISLDGNIDPEKFPYGNQIRLKHVTPEGEFETVYAHLMQVIVHLGDQVQAGDVIALADSTGNSRGTHLHLTLKKRGATARNETLFKNDIIDPLPFLDPFIGANPVIRHDSMVFVTDVSFVDGSVLKPRELFDKTWRVRNNGKSTWTTDYTLAFSSGDRMEASDMKLPRNVEPGDLIDLTLRLTTPAAPGRHISTWRLCNDKGKFFSGTVFADIRVEP